MIETGNRWDEINGWSTRSLARCLKLEFRDPQFNRTYLWTNYPTEIETRFVDTEIGVVSVQNPERRATSYERFSIGDGQAETYTPNWAPDLSAIEKHAGMTPHNMVASGVYAPNTASGLVLSDFTTGRIRLAKATHFWVEPRAPYITPPTWDVFYAVDYDHGERGFEIKFESLKGQLAHTVGEATTVSCRNRLGDGVCREPLTRPQDSFSATVFSTNNTRNRLTLAITATAGTAALLVKDWFAHGYVQGAGSTQNNFLLRRRIMRSEVPTLAIPGTYLVDIETYNAFPENINTGDTFTLVVGCDKLSSTCDAKFSNLSRFRGEPYQPGTRRYQKSGDAT